MVAGIAGGVIGALGLVASAFFLRPADAPVPPADVAATEVAPPAPAEPLAGLEAAAPEAPPAGQVAGEADAPTPPVAAVPLADPALATVTSVRLRVGPGFPEDRQRAIVDALRAAGIASVQVESLPFAITASRVGYYRPEDLPAAEVLGRILGPVAAADGEAIGVRDYAKLLAGAAPGRLDLWIGS